MEDTLTVELGIWFCADKESLAADIFFWGVNSLGKQCCTV